MVIRLLDSLHHIAEYTRDPSQRQVLLRQADMILRESELNIDIDEPDDRPTSDGVTTTWSPRHSG